MNHLNLNTFNTAVNALLQPVPGMDRSGSGLSFSVRCCTRPPTP
jgi:hypothetical protein